MHEEDLPYDLLCGLTPLQIHALCDNPWEGGRAYTPKEVGAMTLDQIFMALAKREILRSGPHRITQMTGEEVATSAPKDGMMKGRAADGTLIEGRIGGESLASRVRREIEEKKAAEAEEKKLSLKSKKDSSRLKKLNDA